MGIYNKEELARKWATGVCEELVKHGYLPRNMLGECIEKAFIRYLDRIRDIDVKYLSAIIGKDPELVKEVLKRFSNRKNV